MLKEINQTVSSVCTATSTVAKALEDGAVVLRIKGNTAKNIAALESIKAVKEMKQDFTNEEIDAAAALLSELGV